jgi:hypothetical protein
MSIIKLVEGIQKVAIQQGKLSELAKTADTSEQRDTYKVKTEKLGKALASIVKFHVENLEHELNRIMLQSAVEADMPESVEEISADIEKNIEQMNKFMDDSKDFLDKL